VELAGGHHDEVTVVQIAGKGRDEELVKPPAGPLE